MIKVILMVVVGLLPCGSSAAQAAEEPSLDVRIADILDQHQVPGAGVALISRDSIIWVGTVGRADRQNDVPVSDRTLFGIGSLSKTLLAMTALVMQERGALSLDTPIKDIIPSLPLTNAWAASDPVRLIHLLEHTSGLDEAHFSLFARTNAQTPLAEVARVSQNSLTTRWRPGDYYAYNNLGAMLAAYVLETATGMPYDALVRRTVLRPLGTEQATYHPGDTTSHLARGYNDSGEVPFPSLPQWPAGSLVASVVDVARVVRTLLNDGNHAGRSVLSPASVRSMETPETSLRARAGVSYGYGKGLMIQSERGYLFYGHGGNYGGFLAEFGYSRELGVGYVILLNNADGRAARKEIKRVLLDYLIPEVAVATPTATETAPSPTALVGAYQPMTVSMDIIRFLMRLIDLQFVTEEDGRLYQESVFGDRQRLLPMGNQRFRRADEPRATSVFVAGPDGNWQWLDETAYQRIPAWWGYAQFYTAAACLFVLLLTLVMSLVRIPGQLMRRRRYVLFQSWPLLAIGALVGMVVSLELLSAAEQAFTLWAVAFFGFGWAFLALSFVALFQSLRAIYLRLALSRWVKGYLLMASLSCVIVATYLLYWDVIGLTLWNY